jgi:hypothetical protein
LVGLHAAILTNMTTSASGWRGTTRPGGWGSIRLDATDDYLAIGPLTLSVPYTFAAWLYVETWGGSNPGLWRDGAASGGGDFNIFQGSAGLPWIRSAGSNILQPGSGYAVSTGAWTQVVFAVTASDSAFYADGLPRHSGSGGAGANFSVYNLGYQADISERVAGYWDDARFWGRSLSAAEVRALYDSSRRGYPGVLRRAVRRATVGVPAGGGGGTLSLSGGLTVSGSLGRSVATSKIGSLSPVGSLARGIGKPLAGAATLSGTTTKATAKALSGSLTPSGAYSKLKVILLALVGTLTAAGSLSARRVVTLALTGTLSLAGSLASAFSAGVGVVGGWFRRVYTIWHRGN